MHETQRLRNQECRTHAGAALHATLAKYPLQKGTQVWSRAPAHKPHTFLCALGRLGQLSGLRLAKRGPPEGLCHLRGTDEVVGLCTSSPVLLHDPQRLSHRSPMECQQHAKVQG